MLIYSGLRHLPHARMTQIDDPLALPFSSFAYFYATNCTSFVIFYQLKVVDHTTCLFSSIPFHLSQPLSYLLTLPLIDLQDLMATTGEVFICSLFGGCVRSCSLFCYGPETESEFGTFFNRYYCLKCDHIRQSGYYLTFCFFDDDFDMHGNYGLFRMLSIQQTVFDP